MTREGFIREYLEVNCIPILSSTRYKKCVPTLILLGSRKAGWSAEGAKKFSRKWFPNKPVQMTLCTYILLECGEAYCHNCDKVLCVSKFSKNITRSNGLSNFCKSCYAVYQKTNPEKFRFYRAERRALLIERIPAWANMEKIKEIYDNCPNDEQVDHIIPLKGKIVSGLHVENNLQYLSPEENLKKRNKY